MIQGVQNKTGTQIHFKKEDVDSSERICIIRGSHEATQLAEKMIKSIIENQPIIEIYEMYVPQKVCGRIIGKGGEVVQHIQISSGAKIIVESSYDSYNPSMLFLYTNVSNCVFFFITNTSLLQMLKEGSL